jgi:hypothetical protein
MDCLLDAIRLPVRTMKGTPRHVSLSTVIRAARKVSVSEVGLTCASRR